MLSDDSFVDVEVTMAQLPVDIPTSNILSDGNCEMSEEDDSDEEILPHIDPGPERIIESSLDGRFEKFNTVIGYGAFKVVFKGRCTTSGSEIAWCERVSSSLHSNFSIYYFLNLAIEHWRWMKNSKVSHVVDGRD